MRRLLIALLLVGALVAVLGIVGVARRATTPRGGSTGEVLHETSAFRERRTPHDPARWTDVEPATRRELKELLYHLRHGSNRKRRKVVLRLIEMGPAAAPAVPELIEFLTHKDDHWGRVRDDIERALGAIGEAALPAVMELLDAEEDRTRSSAFAAIAWMRPEFAVHALPKLVELASAGKLGWKLRNAMARAIATIGEPAIAPLVDLVRRGHGKSVAGWLRLVGKPAAGPVAELLASADPKVRGWAVEELVGLGRNAVGTEALVMKAIREADSTDDRRYLLVLLGGLDPDPRDAVPLLLDLARENPLALKTLGKLGAGASDALPRLNELAKDDDPETSVNAIVARYDITGERDEAIEALRAALFANPEGWHPALAALSRIGEMDAATLKRLMELRKSRDRSANAWGAMSSVSRKLEAPLLQLLRDDAVDARDALTIVPRFHLGPSVAEEIYRRIENPTDAELDRLQSMGVSAIDTMPLIMELIAKEQEKEALRRLRAVPAARRVEALPYLRRRLREGERPFDEVLRLLGGMREHGAPAVPELIALLDDDFYRRPAAIALGRIGPLARRALPALRRHTDDDQPNWRWAILQAIWRISGDRDALRVAMNDPTESVRVGAIGAIGGEDSWALPELRRLMRSGDVWVKEQVLGAFRDVGSKTDLERVANDRGEDENIRAMARELLRR